MKGSIPPSALEKLNAELSAWGNHNALLRITGTDVFHGSVSVQGAKNTAQKIIPMCVLVPGIYRLEHVPLILDTVAVLRIVEFLGGGVTFEGNTVCVDTRLITPKPIPRDLTIASTGTFYFAGALLGRFGQAEVAAPGGDNLGARPVDLHLEIFRTLGATIHETPSGYVMRADTPKAATVRQPIRSAGALINGIQLAFACGEPVRFENIPVDADTVGALTFLSRMGGTVSRDDDRSLAVATVEGHAPSAPIQLEYELPADRNDAATWLLASGIGRGVVDVSGIDAEEVRLALDFLTDLGGVVEIDKDRIHVDCRGGLDADGYHLILGPSPEFHSDWGPFAEAVLARARGRSFVEDRMYDGRYGHVSELIRLGANIRFIEHIVPKGTLMFDREREKVTALEITGRERLTGGAVTGTNVRAAATLALAGAAASGITELAGVDQIARGYEDFARRLAAIGVETALI